MSGETRRSSLEHRSRHKPTGHSVVHGSKQLLLIIHSTVSVITKSTLVVLWFYES